RSQRRQWLRSLLRRRWLRVKRGCAIFSRVRYNATCSADVSATDNPLSKDFHHEHRTEST
ncbi:MAG: hypothetical protein ACLQNE_45610, partial [Thermoguttaceae bacterium]